MGFCLSVDFWGPRLEMTEWILFVERFDLSQTQNQ
jgi:hypothetical protein